MVVWNSWHKDLPRFAKKPFSKAQIMFCTRTFQDLQKKYIFKSANHGITGLNQIFYTRSFKDLQKKIFEQCKSCFSQGPRFAKKYFKSANHGITGLNGKDLQKFAKKKHLNSANRVLHKDLPKLAKKYIFKSASHGITGFNGMFRARTLQDFQRNFSFKTCGLGHGYFLNCLIYRFRSTMWMSEFLLCASDKVEWYFWILMSFIMGKFWEGWKRVFLEMQKAIWTANMSVPQNLAPN